MRDKQHAAQSKPHWLIVLEGTLGTQTETLTLAIASRGARIDQLEETARRGAWETDTKFGG